MICWFILDRKRSQMKMNTLWYYIKSTLSLIRFYFWSLAFWKFFQLFHFHSIPFISSLFAGNIIKNDIPLRVKDSEHSSTNNQFFDTIGTNFDRKMNGQVDHLQNLIGFIFPFWIQFSFKEGNAAIVISNPQLFPLLSYPFYYIRAIIFKSIIPFH